MGGLMGFRLFGGKAAIEDEAAAHGKGTLIARQEQRPLRDLARIGDPHDRRPGGLGGSDFLRLQAVVDFRLQQGVRVMPGQSEFTRMLWRIRSMAMDLVNMMTAPLLAL